MGTAASKGKKKVSSHDRAVLDLKIQRDKLRQYQKKATFPFSLHSHLQTVMDREVEIARLALKANNKPRALLALKKKNYQLQLLEKSDAQLINLEQLTASLEYAAVEAKVLQGLQAGNAVLEEIHKEMSIEAVEKLMQDTADGIAYQDEIAEMLGTKMTAEDEAEVKAELEAIKKEEAAKIADAMPQVPTTEPPAPAHPVEVAVNGEAVQARADDVQPARRATKNKEKLEPALMAA
ncbi:Vacuolar protein sorting-associated protein 20 [Sorochytrium milnesiophthora]